jgi:hypothetical protein
MSGSATFGPANLRVGAITSATPDTTCWPAWLAHTQSNTIRLSSACFSRTVTVTVTVSPMATGRWNFRSWWR